jgi:hypothetical protein
MWKLWMINIVWQINQQGLNPMANYGMIKFQRKKRETITYSGGDTREFMVYKRNLFKLF